MIFKQFTLIEALIIIAVISLSSGFVTYTPDRFIYEIWIETNEGRGFYFSLPEQLREWINLDYEKFHLLHIVFLILTIILFIKISQLNGLLFLVSYIFLEYPNYTTQLRYYPALFLAFSAFFYLDDKKFGKYLILVSLSLWFHLGVLPLLLFYLIVYFSVKKSIRLRNSDFLLLIGGLLFCTYLYVAFNGYLSYYIDHYASSYREGPGLLSSLIMILPSLLISLIIVKCKSHLLVKGDFCEICNRSKDTIYRMLLNINLVLFPIYFLAFFDKVIIDRFIYPVFIFQALSLFAILSSRYNLSKGIFYLFFISIIVIFYIYRNIISWLSDGTARLFELSIEILSSFKIL